MKQRITEKLKCPYCKKKQEYRADKYFVMDSKVSIDNMCDHCDQKFNSYRENGWVTTYPNLTYLPQGGDKLPASGG